MLICLPDCAVTFGAAVHINQFKLGLSFKLIGSTTKSQCGKLVGISTLLAFAFIFIDINECKPSQCGPHTICDNTIGNYTCTCEDHYEAQRSNDPYNDFGCKGK